MGTKTKAVTFPYNNPVRVRLNKELGLLVDRYAEQETGGNRSKAVRIAVKAFLLDRRVIDPRGLTEELHRLRSDLHRVGNNFNQIARALNMDDPIAADAINKTHDELRFQFKELQNLFEAVADAIRKTA